MKTTNDYIAELAAALDGKKPDDEMPGTLQYASQQIMKAAGLTGTYKPPLNAGRMRALLKHIEGLDFAIEEVKMPESPPEGNDVETARSNGSVAQTVIEQPRPRRRNEIDFVSLRRQDARMRQKQRAIDNWWWKEGMFRAALDPCRCSMSRDRAHSRIEVQSEGGRLDNMCPMWLWGRMRLAFPTIFPSAGDGGMDRFMEPNTRWRYVRPREESEFKEEQR